MLRMPLSRPAVWLFRMGALALSAIAALHLAIIWSGAPGYRAFGAGEWMALRAEAGSWVPAGVTLLVTVAFLLGAVFAASAARALPGLPFARRVVVLTASVFVLRGLEDHLMKQPASLVATTTATVALYILNHKRAFINDMETRHGISVAIEASDRMQGATFAVEKTATPLVQAKPALRSAVSMDWGLDGSSSDEDVADVEEAPSRDTGRSRSFVRDDAEPRTPMRTRVDAEARVCEKWISVGIVLQHVVVVVVVVID